MEVPSGARVSPPSSSRLRAELWSRAEIPIILLAVDQGSLSQLLEAALES